MIKVIALYKKPDDVEAFDKHYNDVHLPLVKNVPGLRRLEVARITGSPFGETPYYLITEMYYDSIDAMNEANASSEGKAVVRDVMTFAAKYLTVLISEIRE